MINEANNEIYFALKANALVSINEVQSGLECGCVCPHCKQPLVAKKGDIRVHHFAHYQGTDCGKAQESALHILAKKVIAKSKFILLPEHTLVARINHEGNTFSDVHNIPNKKLNLNMVMEEQANDDYRPDLSCVDENGELLDIEIAVTHFVDEEKASVIRTSQTPTIEIDLSNFKNVSEYKAIEQAVLFSAPRKWIFHSQEERLLCELYQQLSSSIASLLQDQGGQTPIAPDNNIFTIFGYMVGNGYSHKYKSDFNISEIYIATEVQARSSRNYTVSTSGGFKLDKLDMDEKLASKLNQLKLPVRAKLIFDQKMRGRNIVNFVSDIEV